MSDKSMVVAKPMRALAVKMDGSKATIAEVAENGSEQYLKRLFGLVRFCIGQSPDLMTVIASKKGQDSAVRATMKLAQLGLEPTGKVGGAYLVRFKDTMQVLPHWESYRAAAIESGAASDIYMRTVHESDEFDLHHEDGREVLVHRYDPFGKRGAVKGWIWCAVTPDGPVYEPVTIEDVAARKDMGGPMWKNWPIEAELKTVIKIGINRRLSVRNSRKLADLMDTDNAAELGPQAQAAPDPIDIPVIEEEPEKKTSALRKKLEAAPEDVDGTPGAVIDHTPAAAPESPQETRKPEPAPEVEQTTETTADEQEAPAEAASKKPAIKDHFPDLAVPACPECRQPGIRAKRSSSKGCFECGGIVDAESGEVVEQCTAGGRTLRYGRISQEDADMLNNSVKELKDEDQLAFEIAFETLKKKSLPPDLRLLSDRDSGTIRSILRQSRASAHEQREMAEAGAAEDGGAADAGASDGFQSAFDAGDEG